MSDEAKQFIFGLEQCRPDKGMKWHGPIPQEIVELFGLRISESSHGYDIAGVYVQVVPRYEAFTPNWIDKA